MTLDSLFHDTLRKFTRDERFLSDSWNAVIEAYNSNSRAYHNLSHLEFFLHQLLSVKQHIEDWDMMVVAMFYHDVVYDPVKKYNEEESAAVAKVILDHIGVDASRVRRCLSHIRLTAGHSSSSDQDGNYFLDADLAILGSQPEEYRSYSKKIRKEYEIFPDEVYRPGRAGVLETFLKRENIYSTAIFRHAFESKARHNIREEIAELRRLD